MRSDAPITQVRVLCVDDHPVTRLGMMNVLALNPAMIVVGEAASLAEAREMLSAARPDVVLLDVRLRDGDGLSMLPDILKCEPAVRAIVVSSFCSPELVARARALGAHGCLAKDAEPAQIISAIFGALLNRYSFAGSEEALVHRELTAREHQILLELSAGLGNKEIARRLDISEATVRTHVQRILEKLQVNSRAKAVALARYRGLV